MSEVNVDQLRGVDLNLLLILMVVLEERNVTRAAERVGKTQSAISHALGRLRALLGDELLVRAGGGMAPTPQAEALLPEVRQILCAVDMLLAPADAVVEPAQLRRRFAVAGPESALWPLMPRLLGLLGEEAPGLSVQVVGGEERVEARVLSGELALGWAVGAVAGVGLVTQRLCEDRFVCASASGGLTLRAYLSARHILIAPASAEAAVAAVLRDAGAEVALQACALSAALCAGPGCVVTLPARAAQALVAAGAPLVLSEPPLALPGMELSLVYHERERRDAAHRWLREAIARCVETAER